MEITCRSIGKVDDHMMCEFKFIDFTPDEIIKILEHDIKQYQKKCDYHIGIANSYRTKIEELEVKAGKVRQMQQKEKAN